MMLDAVVIILREVLEAALLTSLLMVLSRSRGQSLQWFWSALALGSVGGALYAWQIGWISELWDYTGQEWVNASLQVAIFCAALVLMSRIGNESTSGTTLMVLIVALAMVRELSEVLLYLHAYATDSLRFQRALLGGAIGFVTGVSVGVMLYFGLLWLPNRRTVQRTALVVMAIAISGILVQAVSLLMQIDVLPYLESVWDSSHLISERSVLGQLLYALLGYESAPTPWHLFVYVLALVSFAVAINKGNRGNEPEKPR